MFMTAAHIDEFGRYPMNKGLDDFCQAAAGWLGRRFALPRPIDPGSEILVLNGSREGLFLAAIAAARWVGGRRGRPAMLIPNPFYAAYAAGAVAANCESVYLPATDNSLRASWSCATSRRRKCRCRRSAWPSPLMATRRMWKKIGGFTRKNSISPTRSSATDTGTA